MIVGFNFNIAEFRIPFLIGALHESLLWTNTMSLQRQHLLVYCLPRQTAR